MKDVVGNVLRPGDVVFHAVLNRPKMKCGTLELVRAKVLESGERQVRLRYGKPVQSWSHRAPVTETVLNRTSSRRLIRVAP